MDNLNEVYENIEDKDNKEVYDEFESAVDGFYENYYYYVYKRSIFSFSPKFCI